MLRMLLQAGEGLHVMQSDDLRSQSLPITVGNVQGEVYTASMAGKTHVQMSSFSQDQVVHLHVTGTANQTRHHTAYIRNLS